MLGWIFLIIIIACVIYLVTVYNQLVNIKHEVGKCWSNIDVLLKQRHDELPKLVDTCQQYMAHERETLEAVVLARSNVAKARKSGDITTLGDAESTLRLGLGNLFALSEKYPELKANETFKRLQQRITQIENNIADRRELYNDAVNSNNIAIEQFPAVIVARSFNFAPATLLEFADHDLADPDLASMFSN